jgi:hypothetical protein
MWELVFGRPATEQARTRVALVRHADRREVAQAKREARLETRKAKMVAALAAARRHVAMKDRARAERAVLNLPSRAHLITKEQYEMRPRWLELSQQAYHHNREALRKMRMAVHHRDWLRAQGLMYDLAAIETPISLEEGANGEGDTRR